MKKKPPLSSLSPEEYRARLKKMLIAALGRAWMYWPVRNIVKDRCKATAPDGEGGWWRCEKCGRLVQKLEVDHIIPCIKTTEAFTDWNEYINRRFVTDASQLQGLCTKCHKAKSKAENAIRAETRKKCRTSNANSSE